MNHTDDMTHKSSHNPEHHTSKMPKDNLPMSELPGRKVTDGGLNKAELRAVDAAIRDAMKRELPAGVDNPLFTRKVLNRLPDRKPSPLRWLVVILYILACVVGVYVWARIAPEFFGTHEMTVRTSLQYIVTVGMLGAATVACFIPSLRTRQ